MGLSIPTLPLVSELIGRGAEVVYYSTNDFNDKILSTKAEYRDYALPADIDINAMSKDLSQLYRGIICITQVILPRLLSEIDILQPDCIIHDSIAVWGRYVATIRTFPAVASVSTFTFSKKTIYLRNTVVCLFRIKRAVLRNILIARKKSESFCGIMELSLGI